LANTYLITYEPWSVDADYAVFLKTIESLGPTQHPFRATWVLQTTQATVELTNSLRSALDVGDRLLVVDFTPGSAAWAGLEAEASNGLREALS
jgi:hypothetical protein